MAAKGFRLQNEICNAVLEEKQMLYNICFGESCANIDFYGSIHGNIGNFASKHDARNLDIEDDIKDDGNFKIYKIVI